MSVFFIARQVDYMMNYDLGFNRENILNVNAPAPLRKQYDVLKKFACHRDHVVTDPLYFIQSLSA